MKACYVGTSTSTTARPRRRSPSGGGGGIVSIWAPTGAAIHDHVDLAGGRPHHGGAGSPSRSPNAEEAHEVVALGSRWSRERRLLLEPHVREKPLRALTEAAATRSRRAWKGSFDSSPSCGRALAIGAPSPGASSRCCHLPRPHERARDSLLDGPPWVWADPVEAVMETVARIRTKG